MKIGFFNDFRPCVLKENGVVDISREVRNLQGGSPQLLLENIIVNFQFLRPRLERLEERGRVMKLEVWKTWRSASQTSSITLKNRGSK